MANYICIDGGTTNTRINLVENGRIIDTLQFNVGARLSIENENLLKKTVKKGIELILEKNGKREEDITKILASGMITSEFGLVNLPHIILPAGLVELNASMYETLLSDISKIPFVFIRGVKTVCEDLEHSDMMRGEETELIGIYKGEGVYILPGSHSKIIKTDSNGKIVDFKTNLTGEMIASLSQNTILKNSVDFNNDKIDKEYLIKGFEYSQKLGINEALFKVRILGNLFNKSSVQVYSFYMGVLLSDEIASILKENPARIVIGGKKQIKKSMEILLKEFSDSDVILVSDLDVNYSSALGAIKIYENKGEASL
jgi:2-dehydro-3-deoxygalactonokinase